LNALLKYPWQWNDRHRFGKPRKWGAYSEDSEEFDWARQSLGTNSRNARTVEAEIMDTADDISYAVHDLEDFYRAGMVPLDRLIRVDSGGPSLADEGEEFVTGVFTRRADKLPGGEQALRQSFTRLFEAGSISHPYRGLRGDRAQLRAFTSSLIGRYIRAAKLCPNNPPGNRLFLPEPFRQEIFMLQEMTWHFMILHPALATQQQGQKRLIRELFHFYYNAAKGDDKNLLPPRGREVLEQTLQAGSEPSAWARFAADMVSSMTEPEVVNVAHRILGISQGSAFDQFL
jgi:dGTPase